MGKKNKNIKLTQEEPVSTVTEETPEVVEAVEHVASGKPLVAEFSTYEMVANIIRNIEAVMARPEFEGYETPGDTRTAAIVYSKLESAVASMTSAKGGLG